MQIRTPRFIGTFTAALSLLGGCSAYNMLASGFKSEPDNANIESPQRLHSHAPSASASASRKLDELSPTSDSSAVPIVNYASAMQNAFPVVKEKCNRDSEACSKSAIPENLENYFRAGIGLVNDYCDRWFETLERSEKRLNYQIQNDNVIKQLGTTLLGIGSASRALVATYGAFNTATAGFEDSFKGAFLFAPSANRAHVLVKAALRAKEDKLREKFASGSPRKPTFIEIYNDLVSYGDVCTDSTARRLITDSVSAATASVSADGSVVVQPNVSRESVIAALTLKLAQTKAEDAESRLRDAQRELASLNSQISSANEESVKLKKLASDKGAEQAQADKEIAEQDLKLQALNADLASAQSKLNNLPTTTDIATRDDLQRGLEKLSKDKAIAEGAIRAQKDRRSAAEQAKNDLEQQAKNQEANASAIQKLLESKTQAVASAQELALKLRDEAKAAATSK